MSVTFTHADPPERPEEMTPQWTARWKVICGRLVRLAESRGGMAIGHGGRLALHSPGQGTCIDICLISPGVADVDAGPMHSVSCDWALTEEEDEDLEAIVEAIMDGHVTVNATAAFTIRHRRGQAAGGTAEATTWTLPAWSARGDSAP